MDAKIEAMKNVLKKYGQEHLIDYYEKENEENKKKLLKQMEAIDFELISKLYNNTKKEIKCNNDKSN